MLKLCPVFKDVRLEDVVPKSIKKISNLKEYRLLVLFVGSTVIKLTSLLF